MTRHVATARTIGAILVDSGKLAPEDAERILAYQKEHDLRFGDAALQLGLLSQQDLDHAFARQYNYPYLLKGESRVSGELVAAYEPFSAEVESLRALRSQLMLRWFSGDTPGQNRLAICSAGRGEGRSHLAANLAVIFSQLGEHTLLIDADLRNPRQHEIFDVDNRSGLSAILAGRAEEAETIQRIPDFVDLSLLTAGPLPPNPQELLAQPGFARLLDDLAARYGVILIDTPAALGAADSQTIAARARGALVVARKQVSGLAATQQMVQHMTQVGVSVVGAVVTEF